MLGLPNIWRGAAYSAVTAATLTTGVYASWDHLPQLQTMLDRCDGSKSLNVVVILSGTDERIVEGLKLLKQKEADLAIISGSQQKHLEAFPLYGRIMNDPAMSWRIILDNQALNTAQNARNSAYLLAQIADKVRCVIPVTSTTHMPRVILLMKRTFGKLKLDLPIRPHPVRDKMSKRLSTMREMGKTLLTLIGIEERPKSAYLRRRLAAPQRDR